jgi:hypothetical protein
MYSGDKYFYKTSSSFLDYEFESIGLKGVIKKVARFSKIGIDIFNFGSGDLNELTGEIADKTVRNNGDKILVTLSCIIFDFLKVYMVRPNLLGVQLRQERVVIKWA